MSNLWGRATPAIVRRREHVRGTSDAEALRMRHLILAMCLLSATVSADNLEHPRVVVYDFDGPNELARLGRDAVLEILGDHYTIVSVRTWDAALHIDSRSSGRRPRWPIVAKQTGVMALISGYIIEEGLHHVLSVEIRNAATNTEVDTLTLNIGDHGLSPGAVAKLSKQLDEALSWLQTE